MNPTVILRVRIIAIWILYLILLPDIVAQVLFEDIFCGQSITDSNIGRENQYDNISCTSETESIYGAGDILYRLEIDDSKTVTFSLTSHEGADLYLFLLSDIDNSPGQCIRVSNENIVYDLQPGVHWLIVDGTSNANIRNEGTFTLTLSCGIFPTPCDLEPLATSDGYPIYGVLDSLDSISVTVVRQSCLIIYGQTVFGSIYLYDHDGGDFNIVVGQNTSSHVRMSIFDCGNFLHERSENLCKGVISDGYFDGSSLEAGFYYIGVFSEVVDVPFSFTVNPFAKGVNSERVSLDSGEVDHEYTFALSDLTNDFEHSSEIYSTCIGENYDLSGPDVMIDFSVFNPDRLSSGRIIKIAASENADVLLSFLSYNHQNGCLSHIDSTIGPEGIFIDTRKFPTGLYSLIIDHDKNAEYDTLFVKDTSYSYSFYACYSCDYYYDHRLYIPDNTRDLVREGDRMFFDYNRVSGNTYEPIFVEQEAIDRGYIDLCQGDNFVKCSYKEGDEFIFKILRSSGNVLRLTPFYAPENGTTITSTKYFKLGGVSSVTKFEVDLVSVPEVLAIDQPIRAVSSNDQQIDFIVASNASWFTSRTSGEWFDINKAGGEGVDRLLVSLRENGAETVRSDSFDIIGPNGLSELVIITQNHSKLTSRFEQIDTDAIELFPTITTGVINIQSTTPVWYYEIINQLGVRVDIGYSMGETQININHLSAATYFVRVLTSKSNNVFKIIKI